MEEAYLLFEIAQLAVMGGAVWWAATAGGEIERLHRQRRAGVKRRRELAADLDAACDRIDALETVVLQLHAKTEAGDGD